MKAVKATGEFSMIQITASTLDRALEVFLAVIVASGSLPLSKRTLSLSLYFLFLTLPNFFSVSYFKKQGPVIRFTRIFANFLMGGKNAPIMTSNSLKRDYAYEQKLRLGLHFPRKTPSEASYRCGLLAYIYSNK